MSLGVLDELTQLGEALPHRLDSIGILRMATAGGMRQRRQPRWGRRSLPANPIRLYDRRVSPDEREIQMPREVGDRYVCEQCGAQLVYEKACPCPEDMPHSEICCGKQMKRVEKEAATAG